MEIAFPSLIASGILLSSIAVMEIINRMRGLWFSSVQCWFCHYKTRVGYGEKNSWICQKCGQYNGFTKEGDYNTIIPAHFDEKYNRCITTIGRSKKDWKQGSSLCEFCNYNQELKVKQLAAFVPLNENRYNEEIEHFRKQLEKTYQLCPECNIVLSNVLNSQQDMGCRRLVTNTIKKIQSQNRTVLFAILLLSLLLLVSSVANIYSLQNSKMATVFKNWIETKEKSYHFFENIELILPEYMKGYEQHFTMEKLHLVLIISGILIHTVSYITHKSLWCFLNWTSWVLLVLLSWFPNDHEDIINYLQVAAGFVSFSLTMLILLKDVESANESDSVYEEYIETAFTPPLNANLNKSQPVDSFNSSPKSSPRRFPEKRKTLNSSTLKRSQQNTPNSPPRREEETSDFGLSNLNLGPRSTNHKRQDSFQRSKGSEKSSPILTPPRLILEKPLTRSSSYSSGFGSVCGNGFEPLHSPSLFEECDSSYDPSGYITYHHCSTNPVIQQFSPLAYYHIASQIQRMYMSPQSVNMANHCNPTVDKCKKDILNIWSLLYIFPMLILVCSNIALLWTLYTKDLLSSKV